MKENLNKAKEFGNSLDEDDFARTRKLLSEDCVYFIGENVLHGPVEICNSYEQNMIEGRKKLDKLEWGESSIEMISDSEFKVHFTDFLTHKNKEHTHRCAQILKFNEQGLISSITHLHDEDESQKLKSFYDSVGLGNSK